MGFITSGLLGPVFIAICLCSFLPLATSTHRALHVGLHASWPNTRSSAEALAWIVHTAGNDAALPFLKAFCRQSQAPDDASEQALSDAAEHARIISAAGQQFSNRLMLSTLSWVLHSRQYSPHVHLHYSIAAETLNAFAFKEEPEVFAIRTTTARTQPTLLTDATHLDGKCGKCQSLKSRDRPDPLPFLQPLTDEIYLHPRCRPSSTLVVVYADVASAQFAQWLPALERLAESCKHNVALRFWRARVSSRDNAPSLQGFSVQATLKDTEYGVVDDRVFATRLFKDCGYGDIACNRSAAEDAYLQWQEDGDGRMTFTGVQAAQYVTHKAGGDFDKALESLSMFVEDGPSVTRSREFVEADYVDDDAKKRLAEGVAQFRESVGDGDLLFVNGRLFDTLSLRQGTEKLFQCLSVTSSASMHLGVMAKEGGIDEAPPLTETGSATKARRLRVQLDVENMLPSSLVWYNDMTKDSRYRKWPTLEVSNGEDVKAFVDSVSREMAKTSSPETDHLRLVKVKSHHLSMVLVIDPGDEQQFNFLTVPESIIRADLPIRAAVVMVPNGATSSLVAAGFHYLLQLKGRKTAVSFLAMIRQVLELFGGGYQQVPLTPRIVDIAFQQIATDAKGTHSSVQDVLDGDEDVKAKLEEAKHFAEEMKLFQQGNVGKNEEDVKEKKSLSMLCVLNGVVVKDVSSELLALALAEQERVAGLLVSGNAQKVESEEVSSFDQWVAADPDLIVVRRLGKDMKTSERRMQFAKEKDSLPPLSAGRLFALRSEVNGIKYVKTADRGEGLDDHLITVWLASSNRSSEDFKAAESIVTELASSQLAARTKSRFAIINSASSLNAEILTCSSGNACDDETVFTINGKRIAGRHVTVDDLTGEIASAFEKQQIPEGMRGEVRPIYNRYTEEITSACSTAADSGQGLVTHVQVMDAFSTSNISELAYPGSLPRDAQVEKPISLLAVVDPMSPDAYVLVSVLKAIRRTFSREDVSAQLIIAPSLKGLTKQFDQPKTYNKFLLQSDARFDENAKQLIPPRASFYRLPQSKVLTVAVEPPRAWFVSSFATNYDMDNVILGSLPQDTKALYAEYELRNLIVEGSCIDETENPTQGLKLILENESGVSVDTLVMANLGYFQLKVPTPGLWNLRLAPGPSRNIFSLKTMVMYKDFTKTEFKADSLGRVPIPVESLSGAGGILLRVTRNPGMEGKSVLEPSSEEGKKTEAEDRSVVNRIRSRLSKIFKSSNKAADSSTANTAIAGRDVSYETIHVFSVASGHLYERFLKIMISSVTKHASRPVKFWLLENYLSPSFKKVLPHFAKRHGAQVGMVTYRWPGWLRAQTEKQRIIWAYKILFLDVLFPLDVGRIIFVDSDQVIRGDLAELMDIDLKGAPYGYVPFCDSRKEVEGYRFWKTGFWKETLRGAKYRISALYVVDLNRFRETAAGDTLRFIYQSLSADPNSLSNLDQDLPNYASTASSLGKSVPIFDLPEEWLWCESWCDDESKERAKAIDLCNNPMTKEPKLASAKRIISEWVHYDDAASELTEELYKALLSERDRTDGTDNISTRGSSKIESKESTIVDGSEAKEEL